MIYHSLAHGPRHSDEVIHSKQQPDTVFTLLHNDLFMRYSSNSQWLRIQTDLRLTRVALRIESWKNGPEYLFHPHRHFQGEYFS